MLDGFDVLGYDKNIIMYQGEFNTSGDGDPFVELPTGFTRNKTGFGDVYRLDMKTWRELPVNVTTPRHKRCAVVGNSG